MQSTSKTSNPFPDMNFKRSGLNIFGVVNLDSLPDSILNTLALPEKERQRFSQLIVIGSQGKPLWNKIPGSFWQKANPIDKYSAAKTIEIIEDDLKSTSVNAVSLKPDTHKTPAPQLKLIFPSESIVNLQELGELLGWHYPSPFRIGINEQWGSWFAYRAVVLANSYYTVSNLKSAHPCLSCNDKPCISSCPAGALDAGDLSLSKCIDYRASPNSLCADRCLARMACPVAKTEQYSLKQIQYHYGQSLNTIKRFKEL